MSSVKEIKQNFYNKLDELYVTEQEFEDIDVKDGVDGVGVQSIEQTITSTEDGGDNEVTITLTNGVTATFIVKNGSKGADGIIGKDGKSAYEYAKEKGYTGTEEEFAEVLANTDTILSEAKSYTDTSVAELVGTAPETLDTLEEVAQAIKENEDVVTALNSAIGSKVNQSDLDNYYIKDEIDIKLTELSDSFSSDASNITYNDTTVEVALDELVESTNNLPSAGTKLIETLPANETTVTFTSDEITENTTLNAVYTSIFGVKLESVNVGNGVLTLTFEAQEEDMTVVALINATMSGDGETNLGDIDADEVKVDDSNLGLGVTNVQGALEKLKENAGGNVKSAYQYAVDGGYEGTETEFMALMGNLGAYEGMSNWEFWGEFNGNNNHYVTYPTEWEELRVVVTYNGAKFEMYLTKDEYEDSISNLGSGYIRVQDYRGDNELADWYLYVDRIKLNQVRKGSTNSYPTAEACISRVYFKKKNGVTVDINDLGEWKLHCSLTKATWHTFSNITSNYKEVLISSSEKTGGSILKTKEEFEYILSSGTTNAYNNIYIPYTETKNDYIQCYTDDGVCYLLPKNISYNIYYR